MTVDDLLPRLERVKRAGDGFTARCPAHEDRNPSLSVREGTDGRVLVHCHAGCTVDAITAALGLDVKDLFIAGSNGRPGDPVAVYPYADEAGVPLFEAVRMTGKQFRLRRPNGEWGITGVRRVLYRLPRVVEAVAAGEVVYVVEGEKDVHSLERVGVVATCNPMGAGKWEDEYAQPLAGATVVVVADRDVAGYTHARQVAASLRNVGAAVELRQAAVDGKGADVSDHLAAGHTLDQLVPVDVDEAYTDPTVTFAEFVARRDENAAKPLIVGEQGTLLPAGGLAILAAKTGDGKTTMTVEAVMHASAGIDYVGLRFARPLRVLVVENEGPREAFREKLAARLAGWGHGGDPRVWDDPAAWGQVRISDPATRDQLRAVVAAHGIDLIVSDSLTRFGVRGNGTPEETREFVEWLTELGLGRDVAFLLLHHPRTRVDPAEDELERIAGAWPPHADLILLLKKLDGDRARLSFPKTRWATGKRPASILAFDSDTQAFTYVGDDVAEERDVVAELAELMGDGEWWTVTALRKPKPDGVGAGPDAIKSALTEERFEEVAGDAIGKRHDATYYRLREASRPPHDGRDASPSGASGEEQASPVFSRKGGDACDDASPSTDEASRAPVTLASVMLLAEGEIERLADIARDLEETR